MKALWFDGHRLSLRNVSLPERKRYALVMVGLAGICNTDLEIVKGYMKFTGIPGHEFVGTVKEGSPDLLNKRVVGEINVPCNNCEFCKAGLSRHCRNMRVLGINRWNGAFAEYLILPEENLHVVDDTISDEEAVFTEPLAAAFRITEQVRFEKGLKVAVLGDGKLGILISKALSFEDIDHVVFGKHKEKLSLVKKHGVPTQMAETLENFDRYFDITIDATGNPRAVSTAIKITKPMGKVILKSTTAEDLRIDSSILVVNEISIIGSRCGPFERALKALETKKLSVSELIEHTYPLQDYSEAFERAASGALKVIFKVAQA